ncbi:MAG: efflux RND transporter periplasmic adaptor subunit, partial [Epsilonproteobacteria bacterium]|nr:efflux RND transporter periplasmic adaptor subunit [Campylobacterota bacterium]
MRGVLILLLLGLSLNAKLIRANVPTQKVEVTNKVYAGSYLAIGYLPAKDKYVIDAPVEGVVESLRAKIYEPIKKGELLVRIKSPKILELESEFIDTLIERDFYRKEVARLKPLYEAAVVAKKVYLKTKNTLNKFETKAKFLFNLLVEWGLTKSQ